jgi:hypothetical protein
MKEREETSFPDMPFGDTEGAFAFDVKDGARDETDTEGNTGPT